MAGINAVSNPAVHYSQPVAPKVKAGGDTDGDNDGSKAGQVDKSTQNLQLATSGNLGTRINTSA
jgi:hypothetical protein